MRQVWTLRRLHQTYAPVSQAGTRAILQHRTDPPKDRPISQRRGARRSRGPETARAAGTPAAAQPRRGCRGGRPSRWSPGTERRRYQWVHDACGRPRPWPDRGRVHPDTDAARAGGLRVEDGAGRAGFASSPPAVGQGWMSTSVFQGGRRMLLPTLTRLALLQVTLQPRHRAGAQSLQESGRAKIRSSQRLSLPRPGAFKYSTWINSVYLRTWMHFSD